MDGAGGYSFWQLQESSSLALINTDGTGLTSLPVAGGSNVTWAPNGSKIAFDVSDNSGVHTYQVNADGTNRQQLIGNKDQYSHPSYSPNSSSLAVSSDRNSKDSANPLSSFQIYTVKIGGAGPKILTTKGGFLPSWSAGHIEPPKTTNPAPLVSPSTSTPSASSS